MIIKLILLGCLAVASIKLLHDRRSALGLLLRRSVMLTTIGAGAVAVVFPGAVTDVAHQLGVGRGTDLVVYVLAIAVLMVSIGLSSRLRELDDRFVELARKHALLERQLLDRESATGVVGDEALRR